VAASTSHVLVDIFRQL